jgi:polyisoprenoid-binding protein YceI
MNKRTVLIGLVGAVVLFAGAVWFFFLRSDAPPPATLEDAVASVTSTTAADSAADTAAETTAAPETTVGAREGLDGAWVVDTAVSFVGYRIDEELANLGSVTAVGRTGEIDAALTFTGSAVTDLSVSVDMTTLESDRSQRDSAMRTRGLETSSFPESSYILTNPIELGAVPANGETFTATATGDLSLHGVTQSIELELEGSLVDGIVVVFSSIEIALADYGIEKPTGFSVLGIADVGVLEMQLAFVPA